MNSFQLSFFAADKVIYTGGCLSVIIPTVDGQTGIYAHHENMINAIVPGSLSFRKEDGEEEILAVSSGFLKVENNEVLILVSSAERPDQIDAIRAQRAADRAKEELLQKRSLREYRQIQANLARALARLRVKQDRR